ncbi:MAG: hypothetical protein LBV07_05775 [Syntrophobacterales bacterium]|jgi:hypothetical protein|nr:hypothetical protein [Syntrophobacterales bacterium]
MKKFFAIPLAALIALAVALPVFAAKGQAGTVQWYGASDKNMAVQIKETQNNTRKNASGPKITSNAHSKDFPGLYFIWNAKQKDSGYLKVRASVFDQYERFSLTVKEANRYWDFTIAPQRNQRMTKDGCYVFHIPKVSNNKNINMVFVSDFVEKRKMGPPPKTVPPPVSAPGKKHDPKHNTFQWRGADKAIAVKINESRNNARKNVSGHRLNSNAYSNDFPDLFFIWDANQNDNGYLKIKASVFDQYERFTITAREGNTYWDFNIAPQRNQRRTDDDCYIFYLPKVYNNKNIDTVFVSDPVRRR